MTATDDPPPTQGDTRDNGETRETRDTREIRDMRWRLIDFVWLAAVLLIALWTRSVHFGVDATFDEVWDLRTTTGNYSPQTIFEFGTLYDPPPQPLALSESAPLWRVWTNLRGIQHLPLYSLSLRLWREAFGDAFLTARAFSVACGLGMICFLFAAARLAMDRWAALLVALAAALAPTQIYFSQQTRLYALVTLVAAAAVWVMTRVHVFGPSARRTAGLLIVFILVLLSHYLAYGLLVAICWYGLKGDRARRRAFLIGIAVIAVIYLVAWVPILLTQRASLSGSMSSWRSLPGESAREFVSLLDASYRVLVDRPARREPLAAAFGLVLVAPFLLVRRLPALVPWTFALITLLAGQLLIDLITGTTTLTVTRYIAPITAPVLLLLVGCGFAVGRRIARGVGAALCVMCAIWWHAGTRIDVDVQSFMPAARWIAEGGGPREPIIVHNAEPGERWGDLVLLSCSTIPALRDQPYLSLNGPAPEAARERLGPSAWLITASAYTDPASVLAGAVVTEQRVIEMNVHLYHVMLPSTP